MRIILLSLLLAACGGGEPSCLSLDSHLSAINKVRESHSVSTLSLDSQLQQAAQLHAEYQAGAQFDLRIKDRTSIYDSSGSLHIGENGNSLNDRLQAVGYSFSAVEVAAAGRLSIEEVLDAYLNSPIGHREGLLWSKAKTIGVGCAISSDNRVYWVQVLGSN